MAKNDCKVIYWIKFDINFFKRDVVKFILKKKNGAQAIVLYGQLACLSAGNNGILSFNNKRPYTTEELASLVEMKEKQIKPLLDILSEYELITTSKDGFMCLPEVENKLTSETGKAQRMKNYRNQIKDAAKDEMQREAEAYRSDRYIEEACRIIDAVNLPNDYKAKIDQLSEKALREIYSIARGLIEDQDGSSVYDAHNKPGYLATCIKGIIERELNE